MMRANLWVAVLVLGTSAVAAPVPKDQPEDERQVMEKAWLDLAGAGGESRDLALIRLARCRGVVEFLDRKLITVRITEKSAKKWLKDLGSDDDAVWKPAYENLYEQDPRLVMKLDEVWEAASEKARLRLAAMLAWGYPVEEGDCCGCYTRAILLQRRSQQGMATGAEGLWCVKLKGPPSMFQPTGEFELSIDPKARNSYSARPQRRVGIAYTILEAVGTNEAKAVLRRMAKGNEDAPPTILAKHTLEKMGK